MNHRIVWMERVAVILLVTGWGFCESLPSVAPADLVRVVRSQEDWLHEFKTLYIYAERQWFKENQATPVGENKKTYIEISIDENRVRYYQNDPTRWLQEKVWNGKELRCWEKYYNHPQEHYHLDNTIEEKKYFHELLSCNFGWPRSQSHSFWYDKPNTDLTEFYGRPENFTTGPVETYRGKQCYQLNYLVPEYYGLSFRWYVGVNDKLLYGLQVLRKGTLDREHWFEDYRQVKMAGQFPMRLGWAFYEKDSKGKNSLWSECRVTVREFRVDEPLDDKLFTLEFQPGINIQDVRSGQLSEYTLTKPQKAPAVPQTASRMCQTVFDDSTAKVFSMQTKKGGSDKFSGRPMEGMSMRVHEIDLGHTPPMNVRPIEKPKVRYGKLQFPDAGQTFYHCALMGDQGDQFKQVFCVDLNHNGKWDDAERMKGFEPTKKTGILKTWFGFVDVSLSNADGSQYFHRIYPVYNHYDQLFVVSHSWKEGTIEIDGNQQDVYLIDYQCDGRYDSGRPVVEQRLFSGHMEDSYDYLAWDQNNNGRLDYQEHLYIGSLSVYRGKVYEIAAAADGSQVAIRPVNVPMGRLELPVQGCLVKFHGSRGPLAVWAADKPLAIPADTYWVEYTRYNQNPPGEEPMWKTKSGRYYHQPWIVQTGKTTKIPRELLDTTAEDNAAYEKKVQDHRQRTELARIQLDNKEYNRLLGEPLRDLSDFDFTDDFAIQPKIPLLLCFWDYNQRPSRYGVSRLCELKEMIGKPNLEVVLIHTMPMSDKAAQWIAQKQTAFHIGSITKDPQATRKKWGVKSLPWLIVTNADHKVVAEGLSVSEFKVKMTESTSEK